MIIKVPIMGETTTESLIPKLKELGEAMRMIKNAYPTAFAALKNQYEIETFPRVLSPDLFDKKLEIMLLQDDELRKQ